MVIGCLQLKLSIPAAQSLKDKRMVLRSLKDRMMNKMNVSVAEVGLQDVWKSAKLAVVTVAAERDVVERRLADAADFARSTPEVVLVDLLTEMI